MDYWKLTCLVCGAPVRTKLSTIRQQTKRGQGSCTPWGHRKKRESHLARTRTRSYETMRQARFEPLVEYPGVGEPWPSGCMVCGTVQSPCEGDVRAGHGCKTCARRANGETQRLRKAETAVADMGSRGWIPLAGYPGAAQWWLCRCPVCGKPAEVKLNAVRRGQTSCNPCRYGRLAEGARRAVGEAVLLMEAAGWEPVGEYPGNANAPWECGCRDCGNISFPGVASARKGSRCGFCSTRGLKLAEPALLYLLHHPELRAYKIGTGGPRGRLPRLRQHTRRGWLVYRRRLFETGAQAYLVEQRVLRWLRVDRELPQWLSPEQMPQNGASETVCADELSLAEVWARARMEIALLPGQSDAPVSAGYVPRAEQFDGVRSVPA